MLRKCLLLPVLGTLVAIAGCRSPQPPPRTHADYRDADGRVVSADYRLATNAITLVLWGGEKFTLPQTVSASGARYTDGTWVVWNKGRALSIWDASGQLIFQGCEPGEAEGTSGSGRN